MRISSGLLNKAEEIVFRELAAIADDNALRLFAKARLSDVIVKDGPPLEQRVFDFYTKSHVDFVITNTDSKPLFVVEYDGPFHASAMQNERDKIKDALCVDAGLGILRINSNHIHRRYRGLTVLRWIIEVAELEKAFYSAQQTGNIPWDESFDAAMISVGVGDRRWPYWLSATATQSIHTFIASNLGGRHKGWTGVVGQDAEANLHELSFLWFDNSIIWAKTAVRRQNFEFPASDLLREITTCELDAELRKFRFGQGNATATAQFQPIFERFCKQYNATPSYSHSKGGGGPFYGSWNFQSGWSF